MFVNSLIKQCLGKLTYSILTNKIFLQYLLSKQMIQKGCKHIYSK